IGFPVCLSQTTAVSLWFVIPIPAISSGPISAFLNTPAIHANTEVQISFASCSTQPGCGKNCQNSGCVVSTIFPADLIIIVFDLVVLCSIDKLYFFVLILVTILLIYF